MVTRQITDKQHDILEDSISAVNQAVGMLVVIQNALAGTDGAADPDHLAEAVAGVERILRTAGADLDKLSNDILNEKG